MTDTTPWLVIRPAYPGDRDEMVAFQQIYEKAERAEFSDASVYTLEDAVTILTRAPIGWLYRGYAAFEAGEMVGEGLVMASTVDNLRTARVWVWVAPQHWRRGVGTAVANRLMDDCRALGRDILQTSARYRFERRDDHPYRRFAESLGFELANTEVERRLRLPVPVDLLDTLEAQTTRHHEDYQICTVVGPIPAELAQGYCDVHNRLTVEAPAGNLVIEASRRTPEVLTDQENEIREQGRTRVSALALDAKGTVVALTSSSVTRHGQPGVDQWATIVAPDHRGQQLGMTVKLAQIRLIQSSFPEKSYITTTNAETNAHMVAINEALGFEPRALQGDFQRILTSDPSSESLDPVAKQGHTGVA